MHLARLEISGFKSFAKKTTFDFGTAVVAIVGPNGSGKSNVAEALRFALGEQSMKSMRGKRGEDLIWNGSSGSPRANRGLVALTFDNRSRFLGIDFDEVVIERIVHRDGVNEYRLNGTNVRLKDILELLARANIGQSGHHIISQGEADKILSSSPRERREMLEDALGLKVYQYKLEESSRKLEKTEENIRQVDAVRKEIAPHIRFLKKQVERFEKARELKESAVERFRAYFKRESLYLEKAKKDFSSSLTEKRDQLNRVIADVAAAKKLLESAASDKRATSMLELSKALDDARVRRSDAAKKVARIDGQIEIVEKTASKATVSASSISALVLESERTVKQGSFDTLDTLKTFVLGFIEKLHSLVRSAEASSGNLSELTAERERLLKVESEAEHEEGEKMRALEAIKNEIDAARKEEREKERSLFELAAREREIRHEISMCEADLERLSLEEAEWKRELGEAATLFGRGIVSYDTASLDGKEFSRAEQQEEKRQLEKTKIRVEEMGGSGGEEVMKEYTEVSEREAFLERELSDLESASASLKQLIQDLEKELEVKFKDGIDAINVEFTKLFALMFDGGTASLVRVKEVVRKTPAPEDEEEDQSPRDDDETIEGIDIALSIPRKRVKSLVMLSGGERALTSIALIFAMSSVNPPPFLVLDETDAALDESNSRRYGDMVEALAKKSQLVLITHNRETMSRAGVLYGVTMGNDGVSKVLSVKLEEAVKVAK